MAQVLLSPAELAYLHASLSRTPPIRPDGRQATQFRPIAAETDMVPSTNGSARVCFSDGTEAVAGVRAEVTAIERAPSRRATVEPATETELEPPGCSWIEVAVEMPGARDDDPAAAFFASVVTEAVLADPGFTARLRINRRFHWKLLIDILLISPALSYPLPLLSTTTHLALLATRLPRLRSEGDEDPMFDDDWEASTYLYPRQDQEPSSASSIPPSSSSRPPVTLLVAAVGDNVILDPAREELAVAETALAVSVGETRNPSRGRRALQLLAVRTIDPPSRLTVPGTSGVGDAADGLWRPPVGGAKVAMLRRMIDEVMREGGAADEVLDGLEGVRLI